MVRMRDTTIKKIL